MSHVFISYSTKDAVYANKLANSLRDHGFDVWIDDSQLRSSEDWWQSIVVALWECAAFVVILSPNSDSSRWVQREITVADQRQKPTFPLLLAGDMDTPNWAIFVRTQYEDVRDGSLPPDSFYAALRHYVPSAASRGGNMVDALRTGQVAKADPTKTAAQESAAAVPAADRPTRRSRQALLLLIPLLILMGALALYRPLQSILVPSPPTQLPTPGSGELLMVVAGFDYQGEDGSVTRNDAVKTLNEQFSSYLQSFLSENSDRPINLVDVSRTIDGSLGDTRQERAQAAMNIAEQFGADIILYGVVQVQGSSAEIFPDVLVSSRVLNEFPEARQAIPGIFSGTSVVFSQSIDLMNAPAHSLGAALGSLTTVLEGLNDYLVGRYADAGAAFEQAADAHAEGSEILLRWAGTAATRSANYEKALELYRAALAANADYIRAKSGIGTVYLQLANAAVNAGGASTPSGAPSTDQSLILPEDATCLPGIAVDSTAELLLQQAEVCYREVLTSATDMGDEVNLIEASFLLGQEYVWRSTHGYGDYWEDAQTVLQQAISRFDTASLETQQSTRLAVGNAHANLGLILMSQGTLDYATAQEALTAYRSAVAVLSEDADRRYNAAAIAQYQGKADELATLIPQFPTPVPTPFIASP